MEFFRDQVTQAVTKQQLELDPDIEFYLVNLLVDFINPEKITRALDGGDPLEIPLALQLKTALEAPQQQKVKIYKTLGDTSLYIAGYFQEFFTKKTYDLDYYVNMGSNAYVSLSSHMRETNREDHFPDMFLSLAEEFHQLVEVIAEIADSLQPKANKNILSIYDRWTRSHSVRLQRQLEAMGITPIPTKTKFAQ
jgi:hypothetical protein